MVERGPHYGSRGQWLKGGHIMVVGGMVERGPHYGSRGAKGATLW